MKHDIHNRQEHCKLQEVFCIVSKYRELWSTNGLNYPPCVNSALQFIARLRRRRPANGTQPNFAKRWTVNRANSVPQKTRNPLSPKLGPKNLDLFGFRRLRDLMAIIFKLNKMYKSIKKYGGPHIVSKFPELWSTNGIKWDRYFTARLRTLQRLANGT